MKNKIAIAYLKDRVFFYRLPILLLAILSILTGIYFYFFLSASPKIVQAALSLTDEQIRASNQAPSNGGGWQNDGNSNYINHRWDIWEKRRLHYNYEYMVATTTYSIDPLTGLRTPSTTRNRVTKVGNLQCGEPITACQDRSAMEAKVKATIVLQSNQTFISGGFTSWPLNVVANTDNIPDYKNYKKTDKATLYGSMTPYLVTGYDPGYISNRATSTGYHNPKITLDLWLKASWLKAQTTPKITLYGENFCNSSGVDTSINWNTNINKSEKMYLQIKGANSSTTKEKSNHETTQTTIHCSRTFNISNLTALKSRYLIDYKRRSNLAEEYKKFQIVTWIDESFLSGSYYNQFRLKVTTPNNNNSINSILSFPETENIDGAAAHLDHNVLGLSTRINAVSSTGNLRGMVTLWEITFEIAGPSEKGCNAKLERLVGLYDHDYDQARNWQRNWTMAPTVDISYVNRNAYLDALSNPSQSLPTWTRLSSLEFNGILDINAGESTDDSSIQQGGNVSRNVWENITETFDNNKIYRLRFHNLNSPSWVQMRVPFAQINTLEKCVDKPLFKVHYADISAGGRFGLGQDIDACENQRDQSFDNLTASIYGYANKQGGSSVDYAAFAHDDIYRFYSKYPKNKTSPPNPYNQLTFANDNNDPWGGNFGVTRCIPNYWRGAGSLTAKTSKTLDISSLNNNQSVLYKPIGGDLALSNSNPAVITNLKATVYVEGDLYINANIINNQGNWSSFNQIGYIMLIVKGNIYINPLVNQLDAIVVAYSDDYTKTDRGRIYTCYTTKNSGSLYHNDCEQSYLVMHGSLIGQVIHLGRTLKTAQTNNGVTEEIRLTPEYFVGTPQLPTFASWIYNSDSVSVLPPNF